MRRVNAWLMRFLPAEKPPQGDQLRRALVTGAVAWLFAIVAPLYALLGFLFEDPPLVYYGLAALTAVACTTSLFALRRGRLATAAWILLATGTSAVAVTALREGASSQAAGNLVLPVVMAALIVGWRAALAIGLPAVALVVVLALLERAGLYHPVVEAHGLGVFALVQVGAVTMMLLVFDGVRLGLVEAQRQLEAQLAQAHRLEAVGRVAGGVAHDFNNLLTIILANVSFLAESSANDASVAEIRAAAQRGSQLTKQLLAFSRQQKLEPRTFDLCALVSEERAMLARLIPESIKIEVERPPQPLWAHADPGQISQVIVNLVVNARDAMPRGGTISIAVAKGQADRVVLEVRDTGVGMDPHTLERAFEPFFTTKGQVGTGLGLATVHGIVTQSGGQIRVRSGKSGTTFEVTLPAGDPLESSARQSSGELPMIRRKMILLVEDDDGVRLATARLLKGLGHDVTPCADITTALAAWNKTPARFDLILSDVVMPGGSGPELLRALPPEGAARFMFMSGYTNDALSTPELANVPFISKPFTQRELARKLEEVLGPPLDLDDVSASIRARRGDAGPFDRS
jgi:signal transduction histidine kinase/ActR/RegA family two-component response regulator